MRILNNAEELRSVFSGAFVYSSYITGISLYDAGLHYLISSGNVYFDVDDLDQRYVGITQGTYSGANESGNGYVSQMVYVYPLFHPETIMRKDLYRLGYLVFTLDAEFMRAMIAQGDFYDDTILAVTDAQGKVMLANCSADMLNTSVLLGETDHQEIHEQTVLSKSGWVLHSVMPANILSEEMLSLLYLVWGTAALLLMMVLWMYAFFRQSILKPLNDLRRFMADLPDAHKRIRATP